MFMHTCAMATIQYHKIVQMSGFKCVPEIAKQPSNSIKESKNPANYLESGLFVSLNNISIVLFFAMQRHLNLLF